MFLAVITQGQDYSCIPSGPQFFFDGEHYRAIQFDSVVEFTGRTVFCQFCTIGTTDEYQECYSNQHPSWIGSKITVYDNGDHYFYNVAGDSILIRTSGIAGDEWISYEFGNGDYVRGKIVSVEYTNFLGQADSVKVIKFNAFNSAGNPVSSTVNGMEIKVSKSWGMVQALNFKLFPDLYDYPFYEYIHEYILVGMGEPETGIQNLTLQDIYDFDVGDEFHIHEYSISWLQEQFYYYEIHRVLNKQWMTDTIVVYDMGRCIRRQYLGNNGSLVLIEDTLAVSINIQAHEDPGINEVPDKALHGDSGWGDEYHWYAQHNHPETGKIGKTFLGGYFYDEWQDCIVPLIDYDFSNYYLDGLGGPYWYYGSFGSENYRGLVYYKKGEDEWGEPYDCDSLMVGIIQSKQQKDMNIKVYPNPMVYSSRPELDYSSGQVYTYRLFDLMGHEVQKGTFSKEEPVLFRGKMKRGMYLLQILQQGNLLDSRKLIIQ